MAHLGWMAVWCCAEEILFFVPKSFVSLVFAFEVSTANIDCILRAQVSIGFGMGFFDFHTVGGFFCLQYPFHKVAMNTHSFLCGSSP